MTWTSLEGDAKETGMKTLRSCGLECLLGFVAATWLAAPAAAQGSYASRAHVQAVQSFREGRFPEAYGRFVALANAGHPASARHALWMCEFGLELFGRDWDCAPEEVQAWARTAGVVAPAIGMRHYPPTPGARVAARR
jgi:hypothetical protein